MLSSAQIFFFTPSAQFVISMSKKKIQNYNNKFIIAPYAYKYFEHHWPSERSALYSNISPVHPQCGN